MLGFSMCCCRGSVIIMASAGAEFERPSAQIAKDCRSPYTNAPCKMAAMHCMLAALVVAGAEAGACTPVDSCPKLSDGLCAVNVTEHVDINRDVKLIQRVLG